MRIEQVKVELILDNYGKSVEAGWKKFVHLEPRGCRGASQGPTRPDGALSSDEIHTFSITISASLAILHFNGLSPIRYFKLQLWVVSCTLLLSRKSGTKAVSPIASFDLVVIQC